MSALETLAQAVLDGRVQIQAEGFNYDSAVRIHYTIVVYDPPAANNDPNAEEPTR